jgi:hypothetical protein
MASGDKTTENAERRWNRTARLYDYMMGLMERVVIWSGLL